MTRLLFAPPDLGTVMSLGGLPGGSNKIQDRSSYGNNGTITGATWVKLPSGLWCLKFDGSDDKIVLASAPVTDYPFTLMGWQKSAVGSGERSLISLANSASTQVWWFVSIDDFNNAVLGAKNTSSKFIAGSLLDSSWHLIAGVFASATSRELFVDGVSDGTDTRSVPYSSTNSVCWIGAIGTSTPTFKACDIGKVRIYNCARTALQIQNDFNREKHLFGVW